MNLDTERFDVNDLLSMPFKDKKLFIAEGPDGVGKSTVCKILQAVYKCPVFHLTYFDNQEDVDEQFHIVYKVLNHIGKMNYKAIIFDRFIESNICYTNVFQDTKITKWKEQIIWKLNDLAKLHVDITFIRCLINNRDKYLDRFLTLKNHRKELYGNKLKEMGDVYDEYKKLWKDEDELFDENIRMVNYDMLQDGWIIETEQLIKDKEDVEEWLS